MAGPVALIGGSEFRRDSADLDRSLLARAGGAAPRVGIVPTAATNVSPEVVSRYGLRHFASLGAVPAALPLDPDTTHDPALAGEVAAFGLIYLTDGDPAYLYDTLHAAPVWAAMVAVHQRGALLAGSGAGAMVLGQAYWRVDRWAAGLNLAPGLAVLPHHAALARRWDVDYMLSTLPPGLRLVGVDDATALLLPQGLVLGAGGVTLYGPHGATAYPAGAVVPLNQLLD